MITIARLVLILVLSINVAQGAKLPWPVATGKPIKIAGGDNNLSGTVFSPADQSVLTVRQNGVVWQYQYACGKYSNTRKFSLPSDVGDDIEAITIVDPSKANEIYTLSETIGLLARVDINKKRTIQTWELSGPRSAMPPEDPLGRGPEGLAFVPDRALKNAGFRFPNGVEFDESKLGMDGLIFVGHQVDGRIHVFDINPDEKNKFIYHGSFLTGANETAGLEFDWKNNLLYIWHNTDKGNLMEVAKMSSDKNHGTLDLDSLYNSGMPSGNLEGVSIAMIKDGRCPAQRILFLTKDGGAPNFTAYEGFP